MPEKEVKEKKEKKEEGRPETKEKRIEEIKEFAKKVLEKYGKYIKCIVVMGSVAREEFKPKSDIDVFVVIDDTSFKITPEQHEKIDEDLEKIGEKISKAISVQPSYTLTEFWDYARVCHPIIYNFIKEGIPIYDTGFFGPIKKLLEMGRIPATREAIESYMEGAPKKLMRAKTVKLLMLAEDCYYAMLNTAQAVLMFMGLAPPVPAKAYDDVKKFLVEPGILEPEYAEWLREIIEIRKKIEHKELMDVTGAFVDEWIEKSEKFVDKMFSLLNALELRKKEKILERTHEVMIKAAITALKSLKKMPEKEEEVPAIFKKEFIDSKLIEGYYSDVWKRVEEMKKLADQKQIDKIPDKDVYEMREYVRKLIRDLARVLKEREAEEKK
ncbi:MAG: nucleotidyltransferase domain-containing protein [Candidatus Aenigmarchaeota archaeon]|nr:nucleotidyltransferase domain-containing protein [Candidatus Aenigmarchaeota archaeon]